MMNNNIHLRPEKNIDPFYYAHLKPRNNNFLSLLSVIEWVQFFVIVRNN